MHQVINDHVVFQEERWWPFDVSGQTVLLFLLWPFVAQGLVYLLRKAHKRNRIVS